jgi:hypothetical protein
MQTIGSFLIPSGCLLDHPFNLQLFLLHFGIVPQLLDSRKTKRPGRFRTWHFCRAAGVSSNIGIRNPPFGVINAILGAYI